MSMEQLERLAGVDDEVPDRLLPGFPVRAVLLSHFSGRRDTQVQPAHPSGALLAMGSYNVLRWPSFGRTPLARAVVT